ncbi:MAG: cobalamin-binding protein [Chloroflexi bacterium]|nr:cobalamin-binding protein [Chloroflexota bacterium]
MQEIAYSLIIGDNDSVDLLTKKSLESGITANEILDDGLLNGMAIVGVKFRDNVIFVPEVLISARAMKAGMAHIEPILSESGIEPQGTVLMGTVKGDLHDIGKNLCIMMLRGAGFTVHDLGVDTSPEDFAEGFEEFEPHVVGMSALLTTTMPNMGRTIQYFEDMGLRDEVRMMVGGAPVTQEFADEMGADAYGESAVDAVERAKELVVLLKDLKS